MSPAALSTTEELNIRATHGVLALGVRQCLQQILGALTGIFLARSLLPSEFGIYAVLNFLFFLFLGLGDLGLGAAIIRDRRSPQTSDLRLVFALRQLLDLTVFCLVWIFADDIAALYKLPPSCSWLFRATSLASLITSFQLIPTLLLERELRFVVLSLIEILQLVVQTSVIVILVIEGVGAGAIAWGLIAFALCGALLANMVRPWSLGWRIDVGEIKERLPFSLPFQATGLLSLLKDGLTPMLAGMALGTAEVGFLNLAQMLGTFPVLPLTVLQRIYLPRFSRARDDRKLLTELVERAIFLCNTVAAPLVIMIALFAYPAICFVFGQKWIGATSLIYPILLGSLFVPIIVPLLSLFNSLGRSRIPLKFTFIWAIGNWLIGAPLMLSYGLKGLAFTPVIVNLSALALFSMARREVDVRYLPQFILPYCCAAIMGTLLYSLNNLRHVAGISDLVIYCGAGGIFYSILILVMGKERLRAKN